MQLSSLGFPRIGARRELKFALEQFWRGDIELPQLQQVGALLRKTHWQWQHESGVELLPVGDFAFYDQVLNLSATLGAIPDRHRKGEIDLSTLMAVARGSVDNCCGAASDMSKFFNTNYHYIVPELKAGQTFTLSWRQLLDEIDEAITLGYQVKPVLLGPVTYLHLARTLDGSDKLALLPALLQGYGELLAEIKLRGVQWLQLDEPVLGLELDAAWQQALVDACQYLADFDIRLLLTSYFGSVAHHAGLLADLPVAGLHLDLCAAPEQLAVIAPVLKPEQVLSVGVINGGNVWRADLECLAQELAPLLQKLGERLWLSPSCSLLHSPVDLNLETRLPDKVKQRLSYARQKLQELRDLRVLLQKPESQVAEEIRLQSRQLRALLAEGNAQLAQRVTGLSEADYQRGSDFEQRKAVQQQVLKLPLLPTTTIGSFPQTLAIRGLRGRLKKGEISATDYQRQLQGIVKDCIEAQSKLGLDVLVHGEAERNDMVEYFADKLSGVAVSEYGWVQSYGSRCVKPPLIYGDVTRIAPLSLDWVGYAQSLTDRPVKGMLTGPVTLLKWSFVREDISRQEVATQLALAVRDEVEALQQAGVNIIQVDEPAIREAMPLHASQWSEYLAWSVAAFKLSTAIARDQTQIHTHMCYSEFEDILPAIAKMDADVITIETARSHLAMLDSLDSFAYPNDIGPGVYDIHSPNIPSVEEIKSLLQKAIKVIPVERLWVNPDCGLKTRQWPEVEAALTNMVEAARALRRQTF